MYIYVKIQYYKMFDIFCLIITQNIAMMNVMNMNMNDEYESL